MTATIFGLVGGVGLFLLGMVLLTDGLKFFAGDALRRGRVFGEAISMEEACTLKRPLLAFSGSSVWARDLRL
ncbi:MAG: hypothetical protein V1878_08475 [bacterium]